MGYDFANGKKMCLKLKIPNKITEGTENAYYQSREKGMTHHTSLESLIRHGQ